MPWGLLMCSVMRVELGQFGYKEAKSTKNCTKMCADLACLERRKWEEFVDSVKIL